MCKAEERLFDCTNMIRGSETEVCGKQKQLYFIKSCSWPCTLEQVCRSFTMVTDRKLRTCKKVKMI